MNLKKPKKRILKVRYLKFFINNVNNYIHIKLFYAYFHKVILLISKKANNLQLR